MFSFSLHYSLLYLLCASLSKQDSLSVRAALYEHPVVLGLLDALHDTDQRQQKNDFDPELAAALEQLSAMTGDERYAAIIYRSKAIIDALCQTE